MQATEIARMFLAGNVQRRLTVKQVAWLSDQLRREGRPLPSGLRHSRKASRWMEWSGYRLAVWPNDAGILTLKGQ